jgi:hypothetical protein
MGLCLGGKVRLPFRQAFAASVCIKSSALRPSIKSARQLVRTFYGLAGCREAEASPRRMNQTFIYGLHTKYKSAVMPKNTTCCPIHGKKPVFWKN